ncbi:protein LBH-like [Myxocyprinus asiaticus]|uniref:protein LBH-like n=1 Tax=Myxocyprinus asiaticus TaxID=70543 RepID=UPI0022217E2E|nr:protein LBH-like [Myxocyprinus asiaticus]XP_051542045.1 protein LBH-like [Myxocyprinus asiaticus]
MSKGPQDSNMEQFRLQRRGEHLPYQIFPEPSEQVSGEQLSGGAARCMERLPSIVVEPSEESEEKSGELLWTLKTQNSIDEEEDPFQDHCYPNNTHQGEQCDMDGVPLCKRSSLPGAGVLMDYSRLTPPPSPTSSDAAPPYFRS